MYQRITADAIGIQAHSMSGIIQLSVRLQELSYWPSIVRDNLMLLLHVPGHPFRMRSAVRPATAGWVVAQSTGAMRKLEITPEQSTRAS